MKNHPSKIILTSVLGLSLVVSSLTLPASALADMRSGAGRNASGTMPQGMMQQNSFVAVADAAGEIVVSVVENTAASLTADTESATQITMSDENSQLTISESGTYVVSGECADGNITVKKGTTGVVLVLEDLNLTSTTGATVSVNKESEVQIVVNGNVTLTDAENPDDEDSQDAEVADAYDGAALKIKAGSLVYLTGDGTLTINGSAKNGIKVGDTGSSLVVDGGLTVDITAANDGINAGYDLTILNGTVNVNAADDAIHADRILTVGSQDASANPTINITGSSEGLEGTVVNIFSGDVSVVSSDDAINAANKDSLYESELSYSINITGGSVTVRAGGDGLDSNGNINLTGGSMSINSASFGGEAGIDYDGALYIADSTVLNNNSGIAGPDQMGGMRGGMQGGMQQGNLQQGGMGQRFGMTGDSRQQSSPFQNQQQSGQDDQQNENQPAQRQDAAPSFQQDPRQTTLAPGFQSQDGIQNDNNFQSQGGFQNPDGFQSQDGFQNPNGFQSQGGGNREYQNSPWSRQQDNMPGQQSWMGGPVREGFQQQSPMNPFPSTQDENSAMNPMAGGPDGAARQGQQMPLLPDLEAGADSAE